VRVQVPPWAPLQNQNYTLIMNPPESSTIPKVESTFQKITIQEVEDILTSPIQTTVEQNYQISQFYLDLVQRKDSLDSDEKIILAGIESAREHDIHLDVNCRSTLDNQNRR
jgi:hypothetical protein